MLLAAAVLTNVAAAELPLGGNNPLAGARQAQPVFLPVDEAFRPYMQVAEDQTSINWQIAEGYYLYQHRLQVTIDGATVDLDQMPAGLPKFDEFFGDVEVYYGRLSVPFQLVSSPKSAGKALPKSVKVQVSYQGCADKGLCYPPQIRDFRILPRKADIYLPEGALAAP